MNDNELATWWCPTPDSYLNLEQAYLLAFPTQRPEEVNSLQVMNRIRTIVFQTMKDMDQNARDELLKRLPTSEMMGYPLEKQIEMIAEGGLIKLIILEALNKTPKSLTLTELQEIKDYQQELIAEQVIEAMLIAI